MFFILAGEGTSDLGSLDQAGILKKGPMTWIIDHICRAQDATPEYELMTESKLKHLCKNDQRNIMPSRPNQGKNTEKIWLVAKYLGNIAQKREETTGVILFKDSDGTRSVPRDHWEQMVRAMESGFQGASFQYGVAMVPRPKSEAWLLAYYQKGLPNTLPYQNTSRFEKLPGNDGSSKSAKALLSQAFDNAENPYKLISESEISEVDWEAVDMPSFQLFRQRLQNVIAMINHRSCPHSCQDTLLTTRKN